MRTVSSPVIRLGAWCDLRTEEEERARLFADAAAYADTQPEPDESAQPRPGSFAGYVARHGLPDEPLLDPRGLSFHVEEFAVLADGKRIRLHAERGFTLGGPAAMWQYLTPESLAADVLTTVLPDDAEETGEDHPWEWLADLLRRQGVDASPEQLRTLPYDVEFSDRVRERLSQP